MQWDHRRTPVHVRDHRVSVSQRYSGLYWKSIHHCWIKKRPHKREGLLTVATVRCHFLLATQPSWHFQLNHCQTPWTTMGEGRGHIEQKIIGRHGGEEGCCEGAAKTAYASKFCYWRWCFHLRQNFVTGACYWNFWLLSEKLSPDNLHKSWGGAGTKWSTRNRHV